MENKITTDKKRIKIQVAIIRTLFFLAGIYTFFYFLFILIGTNILLLRSSIAQQNAFYVTGIFAGICLIVLAFQSSLWNMSEKEDIKEN